MSVQARCPTCGAPVTFQVGTSLVTVCPYCSTVVGRGDRGIESLGKVADLVETGSPLEVGIKGRFGNLPFDLTGRTQFQHPAGGVWDEWYAAFPDGKWGWLAEAQGKFYLTFVAPTPENLPSYADLQLGQSITLAGGVRLVVAEKNTARVASARGEIPYRVKPGEPLPFADLSGQEGLFATLDYSEQPVRVYLGREVTLDELQIPKKARRQYPGQEPVVQAVQLSCPQCGGRLDLRAPDRSERVGCPSCGSLLDVQSGRLTLLRSLEKPRVQPTIPLGAVGQREGIAWTCIGFLHRYITSEGVDYYWEEYLLYQPRLGFRWLTRSDEHWNWVEPLPPGVVEVSHNYATYANRSFRLFQKATAKVALVFGEFYWKVQAGDSVKSRDYVAAPDMLSEEVTRDGEGGGEVNWSLGSYVQASDIQSMFSLPRPLPGPMTIGPNQPFPYSRLYPIGIGLIAALCLLALIFWLISPQRTVFARTFELPALPDNERGKKFIEAPISLHGQENLRLIVAPKAGAGWTHIEGKFTPAGSPVGGTSRSFAFLSDGSQSGWVYLSSVPAGEYDLTFTLSWQNPKQGASAEVRIEQGVAHPFLFMLVLALLVGSLVIISAYQFSFESRRWQDSNVT